MSLISTSGDDAFEKMISELHKSKADYSFEGCQDQGFLIQIISGESQISIWFDTNGDFDQVEIERKPVEFKDLTVIE